VVVASSLPHHLGGETALETAADFGQTSHHQNCRFPVRLGGKQLLPLNLDHNVATSGDNGASRILIKDPAIKSAPTAVGSRFSTNSP